LNNFVLDPQHMVPGPTTPAAVNDRIITPIPPPTQIFPMPLPGMINPSFIPAGGMNNGQQGMNLVQQQMMMMMQMQQAMLMGMNGGMGGAAVGPGGGGGGGRGLADRVGGFADVPPAPLPPAPAGGEDPRAKRGRLSYRDLDEPGGAGDGGLPY